MSRAPEPRLYVISGSHACSTAMLMLAHKQVSYRRVRLPTGLHPMLVRALGFPGHKAPIRTVDGGTGRTLALLDRMGTVPALRWGSERVQTNRRIARFLEHVAPHLALLAYRLALRADIEARPAGALMERVLPEPALST